jgi:hypothetical protein
MIKQLAVAVGLGLALLVLVPNPLTASCAKGAPHCAAAVKKPAKKAPPQTPQKRASTV